jgi:hypothetical protein
MSSTAAHAALLHMHLLMTVTMPELMYVAAYTHHSQSHRVHLQQRHLLHSWRNHCDM